MTFEPPKSSAHRSELSDLLKKNRDWWRTPGSLACHSPVEGMGYDRDEIMQENHYSDVIVRLNEHLITVESQCGRFDSQPVVPNREFLLWREEADQLEPGSLTGLLSAEYQRPYLMAIVSQPLQKRFQIEHPTIGIMINYGSFAFLNQTYREMMWGEGGLVNVTRVNFQTPEGTLLHTSCPTNVWRSPEDHTIVTFVGSEYRDDNEQMLRTILDLCERPD